MRYLELDAMRGLAALSVVLFHYTSRYFDFFPQVELPAYQFTAGWYGVNLFFVISGFVISFSASGKSGFMGFLKGRIIRLYPLYWVCMSLTFAVFLVFPIGGLAVDGVTFIVNFTMLQKFIGFDNVDGAYWTLAIEWLFYGLIICLLLMRQFNKIFGFVLFMILANIAILVANSILTNPIILPQKLAIIFDAMAYFACGVSFYLFKSRQNRIYILTAFLVLTVNYLRSNDAILILDILIFITFYLFTADLLKWISIKPLIYLGNLSYALYLIHQNIGYIVIYYTIDFLGPELSIAITIICALIFAHFIDKLTARFITPIFLKYLGRKRQLASAE